VGRSELVGAAIQVDRAREPLTPNGLLGSRNQRST